MSCRCCLVSPAGRSPFPAAASRAAPHTPQPRARSRELPPSVEHVFILTSPQALRRPQLASKVLRESQIWGTVAPPPLTIAGAIQGRVAATGRPA